MKYCVMLSVMLCVDDDEDIEDVGGVVHCTFVLLE